MKKFKLLRTNLLNKTSTMCFVYMIFSVSAIAQPSKVNSFIQKYCADCHDEDTQKGKVRLDNLSSLSLDARLEMLNRVQEQIYIKEMPPKKKKKQPSNAERHLVNDWLGSELKKHNAAKLEEKLRYPDYGNYVDHDKLFSGEIKDKAYTPARRWLVSPQIFTNRVIDIFKHSGQRNLRFYGVTNPIILPSKSGVRYYDNVTLDGGHLLVMLTNAEWISKKQIFAAQHKGVHHKQIKHENPKDRWFPRITPPAFEKIILKKSAPTKEELVDAIQTQFDCVLGRKANAKEVEEYLSLTKKAIEITDNTEGLRQMLKSVILESEFLYRMEFGAGPVDKYGRQKLAPEEAAFAISYALGDRGPDAKLLKAAKEGKLLSKEDYKREIERLLADKNYYKNKVDSSLDSRHMQSHMTSHPKIVRFFREFLGYYSASKVFKDIVRSDGYYQNPGRGTSGTGGYLINEADMIVDYHIQKDKQVFENLFGSEEFFAGPIDKAVEKMETLMKVYNRFKDLDWEKNGKEVLKDEEHLKFLRKHVHYRGNERQLKQVMTHAKKFVDKGLRPHPYWSYPFNHLTLWVRSYNIQPFDWNYPHKQPFKINNRKGILTHPAWLIAHSQNLHTDPVIRGKWVREKLLAGRVPDIPITVDAQVPEDHHETLRERFDKVTGQAECWRCHQHMNPLGYPFEIFDDFGRFRTQEPLEHEENIIAKAKYKNGTPTYKTKPVNAQGELQGTGDPNLDGKVTGALEMIDRLVKSKRVRQSIIRHAFRFYMGRNEMLSDSQTLIDADNAYVKSGGSFKAVIVSLLTSDSFIYRKN